jgi:hypothetical protein
LSKNGGSGSVLNQSGSTTLEITKVPLVNVLFKACFGDSDLNYKKMLNIGSNF